MCAGVLGIGGCNFVLRRTQTNQKSAIRVDDVRFVGETYIVNDCDLDIIFGDLVEARFVKEWLTLEAFPERIITEKGAVNRSPQAIRVVGPPPSSPSCD